MAYKFGRAVVGDMALSRCPHTRQQKKFPLRIAPRMTGIGATSASSFAVGQVSFYVAADAPSVTDIRREADVSEGRLFDTKQASLRRPSSVRSGR
jgi:hypothetical protein